MITVHADLWTDLRFRMMSDEIGEAQALLILLRLWRVGHQLSRISNAMNDDAWENQEILQKLLDLPKNSYIILENHGFILSPEKGVYKIPVEDHKYITNLT